MSRRAAFAIALLVLGGALAGVAEEAEVATRSGPVYIATISGQ